MVYASVNKTSAKQALPEAMVQLGQSIQQLVTFMADNYNLKHPFNFAKLDIKDSFWQLVVNEEDAWNFYYVLPPLDGYILASIDDVELVVFKWSGVSHCHTSAPAQRHCEPPAEEEVASRLEVFVDDFISTTTNFSTEHLRSISTAMLHGMHSIYPPLEVTGHPDMDPVAEKKLDKEDSC
eukprot:7816324-Ditylum_brightwellii.AAC.1